MPTEQRHGTPVQLLTSSAEIMCSACAATCALAVRPPEPETISTPFTAVEFL